MALDLVDVPSEAGRFTLGSEEGGRGWQKGVAGWRRAVSGQGRRNSGGIRVRRNGQEEKIMKVPDQDQEGSDQGLRNSQEEVGLTATKHTESYFLLPHLKALPETLLDLY